ncbi:uroporphyrinogen-III C-methyltransferase [Quadrisphaera granulorum]|uniref:Uroporphyrinogen-III C-methyltransferase n=1 Tax=Quadrisphaera granulorum TaxID=317664 RepID=A0A316A6I2_9ACTN|nr:uroporphyrinogen-III C-methyltransferase [Quadrisphaera granulorum]PWJ53183.1 uroporphyrinogen-III C-methyltransferase [Quadrisphaera granulorum]SZE97115.1 uroporphyrinogen-III C-methyltransferase [Quadrisphaera granulorum]
MSPSYPLHLDLEGRRVVVVGGGPVAARRARGLLEAGADVLVVAPEACAELADLDAAGEITWRRGRFCSTDLDGAWLVQTATGVRRTDDAVSAEATSRKIWCVRADDATRSRAWTPAVVRHDDVVVSVTAGGDPRRAVAVRDGVRLGLSSGALPLRRHRRPTGAEGARPGIGRVTLVGGGPGDADLITLAGRRALAEADVVVVDRLAPRGLLAELDADVEVVDVGKSPDHHPVPQREIERVLIDRALRGLRVVRLKGGDGYVFGRGGEELAACRAAGVTCDVIPGITSALAVPAAAGIPVTHRGVSRSVTVMTGHDVLGDDELLDLAAQTRRGGTLVVLMGVSRLGELASGLVAQGADPQLPIAVIERGCTPQQRTTTATLADAAAVAVRRGVKSPAVLVFGAVAAMAHSDVDQRAGASAGSRASAPSQ